jgi:deoxyribonuclease-4
VERIGAGIREALDRAPGACAVFLENTAGAGDTVGRTFEQLRMVADAAGGGPRVGFCLDTQHLFASGFPVHEPGGMDGVLEDFDRIVGIERLRCLHLNDSKVPFACNRDRHENVGDGEIGEDGMRNLLGCPALQGLPVVLEVPGDGDGPRAEDLARARALHAEALALRA